MRLGVTTDANGREHYEYDDNPAPQACQSITSAVFLPLTDDIRQSDLETQQTAFRGITLLQNDADTMAARFLKQIGLDYTVLERRPIRVASVADYRK